MRILEAVHIPQFVTHNYVVLCNVINDGIIGNDTIRYDL